MATLKPPFRAKNMHELFKRVSKGVFPPISNLFSKGLASVIASMLKVNSKSRPSADELLQMDIIVQKVEAYSLGDDVIYDTEDILLQTIRLPSNGKIKHISSQLPKSNYGDLSTETSLKSQLGKDSISDSFKHHAKTKSAYSLDIQSDETKKQKLETLLQNCYVVNKDKITTKNSEIIPKYYAVGERRKVDKSKFSSRNYGIDVNDYVFLSNNNSSINLSRINKSRRDNSNIIKLKKYRADKIGLERYVEDSEKSK